MKNIVATVQRKHEIPKMTQVVTTYASDRGGRLFWKTSIPEQIGSLSLCGRGVKIILTYPFRILAAMTQKL
jgi:hypothetical protein